MEKSELEIVSLSALDLKGSIKNALDQCAELDIPVLIPCPQSITVWAVPNNFTETVSGYKKLEENEFTERTMFNYSVENILLFEKLNISSIWPVAISNEVALLQLNTIDVKKLKAFGKVETSEFSKAYNLSSNENFKQIKTVVSARCKPSFLIESDHQLSVVKSNGFNLRCEVEDFEITTCDRGMTIVDAFDDPLNNLKPINITFDDCFFFTDTIKQLVEYTVDDLPENSPYFVPLDCRHLHIPVMVNTDSGFIVNT